MQPHVFIIAGEPKTGKTILGNLVKNSPSALVLDDFVIAENISEHLTKELDSKDPLWQKRLMEDPTFVLFIIVSNSSEDEVIDLMRALHSTLFIGINKPIALPITFLTAEDGDFYL